VSTDGNEVALVNCVDDVSSESDVDERVKAATLNRPSDADEDAETLLADTDEVDENNDMLGMVEFDSKWNDADIDAGTTLLPDTLVGAGERVKDSELVAATARAEAPDANGYAGTVRSLGYGGTAGTVGRATVGTAGTAGTCGKEGTAGTGTEGGTTAAGDATDAAAFTTADIPGTAAEPTALTMPGTTGATSAGCEPCGEATACVFVSWPTRFPLVSTVATTSTLTVRTLVADAA
jgi:hypothetical protein